MPATMPALSAWDVQLGPAVALLQGYGPEVTHYVSPLETSPFPVENPIYRKYKRYQMTRA